MRGGGRNGKKGEEKLGGRKIKGKKSKVNFKCLY